MALIITERMRPCLGYRVSGDSVVIREWEQGTLLAVIDGVGHGEKAAEAATVLQTLIQRTTRLELPTILDECNRAASSTRGAAVGLVHIPHHPTSLSHIGVGNIGATLWTPGERSETLVNHNGIVGRLRSIPSTQEYAIQSHQILVMHSDGISSRKVYQEMAEWDGQLERQADRIMEHASARDDVALLLVQIRQGDGTF